MKLKWSFPFIPIGMIYVVDPKLQWLLEAKWFLVAGSLILTGILLIIIKPWRPDDGTQ